MAFSYNKLWKLIIDRSMNKTKLRDEAHITNASLSRLSKNQNVSMDILERLCMCLKCDISDIVEYIDETGTEEISWNEIIQKKTD